MNDILGLGHWQFARCPIILRRWHSDISLEPKEPKTISIWTKLHGILSNMAHVRGISFVVARFGHPLITDTISAKQSRLDYARVCLDLDATKPLQQEAEFCKTSGHPYLVRAEYKWLSSHCHDYSVFRHSASSCLVKASKADQGNAEE